MAVLVHKFKKKKKLVAHSYHKQPTTPTIEVTGHTESHAHIAIPLKTRMLKTYK